MKLAPYNRENMAKSYRLGKNQKLLLDFIDSGLDCARVEDFPHKSATICQSVLRISAARIGLGNSIRICTRGGEVYLLRKTNNQK